MRLHLHLPHPRTHPVRFALQILLLVFLVGAGYVGWQAYHVYTAVTRITSQYVPPEPYERKDPPLPPLNGNHRINILLLGSDNDKKKEEASPLTQSMIVVTVDPVHYKVGMLSIPRDFWVPIHGHGWAKIDLAHKYGGVALARATVRQLFHIPIHYYAWVGLSGFIKVIDTFDGVTLDVLHPILDDSYPDDLNTVNPYAYKRLFIPAGWQHMDGSTALQYVRSRHGDAIGDFGRSTRQQQVLLELENKVTTLDLLQNLPTLAGDLQDSVRTDLNAIQLWQLSQLARHIHPGDITQVVLQAPFYSQYGWRNGQSVVVPHWPKILPLVRSMFAPVVPPSPTPPTSTPRPLPEPTATKSVTSTPTPTPTARPAGTARPTATPTPTPLPPVLAHLPGTLLFVQGGHLMELTRSREVRQLTSAPGDHDAMPSPSPDGRFIAFVRFSRFDSVSDLWILDRRTGRTWSLTDDTSKDRDVRNNLWAAWPSWLGGDGELAFSWDRGKLAVQPPSDARYGDLAVWQMQTNGRNSVQLTKPAQGAGGDQEPVARPRTRQLLYVRWDYLPANNEPYSQLVLLDPVSRRSWRLTPVGGRVLEPAWDASGTRLTYVRRAPDGTDEIAVATLLQPKTGPQLNPVQQRTVIARGRVAQPAFTPDGKWISYLLADGDGFSLYLAPAGGGPSLKVGEVAGAIDARWHPVWLR
ncbi:MAG: LCP family protein [Chloroflexi bacterium]|nr:LCP family protein [Chloroflexota bacterium]